MSWAVAQEGRLGRESVLLLIEDRAEAEDIAMELRRRGQCVVVWPYREGELP